MAEGPERSNERQVGRAQPHGGKSGRTLQATHWPWSPKAGVKPRFVVTKGPKHPWRSQHPKARLARNN